MGWADAKNPGMGQLGAATKCRQDETITYNHQNNIKWFEPIK